MRFLKRTAVAIGLTALLVSQWEWIEIEEYFQDTYVDNVFIVAGVYCQAPQQWRVKLRELINEGAAPHKIRVECAGDAL